MTFFWGLLFRKVLVEGMICGKTLGVKKKWFAWSILSTPAAVVAEVEVATMAPLPGMAPLPEAGCRHCRTVFRAVDLERLQLWRWCFRSLQNQSWRGTGGLKGTTNWTPAGWISADASSSKGPTGLRLNRKSGVRLSQDMEDEIAKQVKKMQEARVFIGILWMILNRFCFGKTPVLYFGKFLVTSKSVLNRSRRPSQEWQSLWRKSRRPNSLGDLWAASLK